MFKFLQKFGVERSLTQQAANALTENAEWLQVGIE